MLKNFFKIAIRTLLRNKIYSFINIVGLSIGVACFILIFLFVKDELSYDKFNTNADRIFRINVHYKIGENRFNMANSPAPLADALTAEYPEIKKAVRIYAAGNVYVKKGDEYLREDRFLYADSTLFDVFTIEFVNGSPEKALAQPDNIVITTSAAAQYFGSKDPVGEKITLSDGKEFIISGIVKPLSDNSSFEFDFAASLSSLPVSRETNWFGSFVHTYVLTNKEVTAEQLNSKTYSVAEKYVGPIIKAGFGLSYKQFLESGNDFSLVFVPLKNIHLFSYSVFNELKETGNIDTVYLFSAIAIFILIIACINFVNLATAKSSKRTNEIGVRKVLGSNKALLIKQFLSESIFLCFIALIISLVIVEIALPYFNDLAGKKLSMDYLSSYYVIPGLLLFTLLLGSAAGIYPALLLASFKPILVLKGKSNKSAGKNFLRKGLVVFQFATSIILFSGTLIIYNQMEYIRNKNLGFNKDQILVVKNIADLGTQQFPFANTISNHPGVINTTLSRSLPDYDLSANIYRKEGESHQNQTLVTLNVDYDFLETYAIKMKEGRYFSKEISTDTMGIILNESAVKKLGYSDALNTRLSLVTNESNSPVYNVIGVVKDFHLTSLKDEIRPAVLVLLNKPEATYLSIKVSSSNITETIKYISNQWKQFGQLKPMEYSFFDENFAELYRSEIQMGDIFTVFAILAIVIACLGLFGLAAFTAEQRTKEIGIRKVLGSTIPQIILLLSKEFITWVLISNLIAWPAAYYIMENWLNEFPYRINIGISIFLLTGLAALIIAVITISYQAIKAALANPVKSLKYE